MARRSLGRRGSLAGRTRSKCRWGRRRRDPARSPAPSPPRAARAAAAASRRRSSLRRRATGASRRVWPCLVLFCCGGAASRQQSLPQRFCTGERALADPVVGRNAIVWGVRASARALAWLAGDKGGGTSYLFGMAQLETSTRLICMSGPIGAPKLLFFFLLSGPAQKPGHFLGINSPPPPPKKGEGNKRAFVCQHATLYSSRSQRASQDGSQGPSHPRMARWPWGNVEWQHVSNLARFALPHE